MSRFRRLRLAMIFWMALTMVALPLQRGARADTAFPQTGQSVWGPFEEYWKSHGGLDQFGMPRTSVYSGGSDFDAQWFERALFTYTPSNPVAHRVELHLLGSLLTASRRAEAPFVRAARAGDGIYFEATGHNLSGKFLSYWNANGGLPIYGYPISEPFSERSKSDGKTYTVQYFERNRFEYHPELAGTRFEVQLGLLGSELLDKEGGPAAFSQKPAGKFYPQPVGGVRTPPGDLVDSPNAGTPDPTETPPPAAPPLPATSRPNLFSADFSTPSLSDWQAYGSYNPPDAKPASWSVRDGMVLQSGKPGDEGSSEDALLVVKGNGLGNGVLEAHALAVGEPVGLVARWTPGGYYLARIYLAVPNNSPKAQIVLVTPERTTVLAESTTWPGYTSRQWHLVAFTAQGGALRVAVDGQVVARADDTRLSSGLWGLYAYADGTARFDNVRITAP